MESSGLALAFLTYKCATPWAFWSLSWICQSKRVANVESLLREHKDQYHPSVSENTSSWLLALVTSLNWVVISSVNVKNGIMFVNKHDYYTWLYLKKRKKIYTKQIFCLVGTLKICDFTYRWTCKISSP